jgi:hypothetical protein
MKLKRYNVYLTKHAKDRYYNRHTNDITNLKLPNVMRLYKDNYNDQKYYYNLDRGFMVLKKVGKKTFIIKTITKKGKIDDREYIDIGVGTYV